MTIRGILKPGVEGCTVLSYDRGTALLIGVNRAELPPFGTVVEVVGVFQPNLATNCMQGTPFEVTRINPV